MAIVTIEDDIIENETLTDKNDYRTVEITNENHNLDKIVQYIDGQEWTVDYFVHLIARDNGIGLFDPLAPDPAAQFAKIKDLILFVDSPLTQGTANDISGSAYINANITPNQGDIFVATLLGKRKAIFRVEGVEKKNYNLNNVYLLEYKLYMFIDNDDAVPQGILTKVVKNYRYDKDYLLTNSTPILLEDKFEFKKEVTLDKEDLTNYYLKTMYHSRLNTLAIPGQEDVTIDIMMQEFTYKVIDIKNNGIVNRINRLQVNDEVLSQPTILTALLKRDPDILKLCNREVTVYRTDRFISNVMLRTIVYLGIEKIVYPKTIDENLVEMTDLETSFTEYTLESASNPYRSNKPTVPNLIPTLDVTNPYYVFTEAFYNNDTVNMSILEFLTMEYLYDRELNKEQLMSVIDDCKYWDRVQQFYFIPIVILLIRDYVNNSFSNT